MDNFHFTSEDNSIVICPLCECSFTNWRQVSSHLIRRHGEIYSSLKTPKNLSYDFSQNRFSIDPNVGTFLIASQNNQTSHLLDNSVIAFDVSPVIKMIVELNHLKNIHEMPESVANNICLTGINSAASRFNHDDPQKTLLLLEKVCDSTYIQKNALSSFCKMISMK